MDVRRWQWRNSWQKKIYLLCNILFLSPLILLQQQATASDAGYHVELKNAVPDPSSLDSRSNYLPYSSRDESENKRASAFFPLRGKKPSTDDILGGQHLFLSDHDMEEKRAQFYPLRGKKVPDDLKRASYFMPMRGRKDDGWIEEDYDITDESPNKRASSFMPMRGKKKYAAISDYLTKAGTYPNDVSEVIYPSGSDSNKSTEKRMHSFVPVRGKRSVKESEPTSGEFSLTDDSKNEQDLNHSTKKRSASFMPMRGRRELDESDWSDVDEVATSLLEKKKHSFMPMRGRRNNENSDDLPNLDKKAAAFMPMRGRRYSNDEYSDEEAAYDAEKRAQSFMPMRGRRTLLRDIVYESPNLSEMESKLIEEKRASSFMPMRGRRSVHQETHDHSDHDKKSSSFMPMRGKRSIENIENEDMYQSESTPNKRVAFMPMRGRKSEDEDFQVEPWPSDQLHSLFDKKASSFMPMRGRRYTEDDFTVAPWPVEQLMPLLDKKSSFLPMRGRRYVDEDFTVSPWPAEELMSLLDKKSSSFMPMRGRRYEDENFTVSPWPAEELMPLFNKKSSSFMPMRGRRYEEENFTVAPWPAEQLMPLLDKKSAFMPMRGRSTITDENIGNINSDKEDKRSSSFMPMRGRRMNMEEANFYNPYPYLMAGIGSSLIAKPYSNKVVSFRSPAARRKKLKINWDAVKRAFHAARGKRFDEIDNLVDTLKDSYTNVSEVSQQDTKSSTTKGSDKQIRTKRSIIRPNIEIQPRRQYIALKRPMSFFATRGKRLDDSAIENLSKLR